MDTPAPLALRSVRELLLRAASEGATGWVRVRERGGAMHQVGLRHGRIAQVRVAGPFDPLLERLRRGGSLDLAGWRRVVEALGRSERRSGQLAMDLAGLRPADLRRALDAQARGRLRLVLERAQRAGRDAWLERRDLPPAEAATSLPVPEALPLVIDEAPRACPPASALGPPPVCRPRTRRELRRVALLLHPDRHPDLDDGARAALAGRLAVLTAAFHGLG